MFVVPGAPLQHEAVSDPPGYMYRLHRRPAGLLADASVLHALHR